MDKVFLHMRICIYAREQRQSQGLSRAHTHTHTHMYIREKVQNNKMNECDILIFFAAAAVAAAAAAAADMPDWRDAHAPQKRVCVSEHGHVVCDVRTFPT